MNDSELWSAISRMLSVLTIGHTSMMLLSKLVGLSENKWSKTAAKLIECAALAALLSASASIVHNLMPSATGDATNWGNPVPSTDTVATALSTYYLYVAVAWVGFFMLLVGFFGGNARFPLLAVPYMAAVLGLVPLGLPTWLLMDLVTGARTKFHLDLATVAVLILGALVVLARRIYDHRKLLAWCGALLVTTTRD